MLLRLMLAIGMLLIGCLSGGCSVAMAASGRPDPNLSFVRVGATRGEVELQIGHPISSVQCAGGLRTDTYEYKTGAEASPGRAVAHGVLDVLTLGIWEVAGTPIEATQLGTKHRVTLTYDANDKVLAVNEPVKPDQQVAMAQAAPPPTGSAPPAPPPVAQTNTSPTQQSATGFQAGTPLPASGAEKPKLP